MKNLLLLTLVLFCMACKKEEAPLTIESFLQDKSVQKINTNPSGAKVFFLSSSVDPEAPIHTCSLPLVYQLSCTDGSKTLYFEKLRGVVDMAVDEECNLYAIMGNKVVKFTPPHDSTTIKTSASGFTSIITDATGGVWAATYGEGLYYTYDDTYKWQRYSSHNSNLTGNNITEIAIGKNNDIWAAVSGDTSSLAYISNGSITSYKWKDMVGKNFNYLQQLAVDKEGNAWVSYYLDSKNWFVKVSKTGVLMEQTPVTGIEFENVKLRADFNGDIYFIGRTTGRSKIFVNNGTTWKELKINTDLYIFDATIDSQQNLWLGTQNGIIKTTVQMDEIN